MKNGIIESVIDLENQMKELRKENSIEAKPPGKKDNTVTIGDKVVNLSQLGIDFKLNEQQVDALNQLSAFLISDTDRFFTLSGYAGTGKSSIVKILLKWIRLKFGWSYNFQITAPTNRAKYVIESLSNQDSLTLHSILGLQPDVDIEKLNTRNLKFDSKKGAKMPNDLLIVDECSMVNDVLLDSIIEKANDKGCKVIFIGDKAQLKPVKQEHISRTFDLGKGVELTIVERQKDGNKLVGILEDIRNKPFDVEHSFIKTQINDKGEGLYIVESSSEFFDKCIDSFKNVVFYTDYLNARVITFTNKRAELYNNLIRNKLGFTNEYHKGELLMAYANVGSNYYTGEKGLINSCDYIIENDIELESRMIGDVEMLGYRVELVSTDVKQRLVQFILSKENPSERFADLGHSIEEYRFRAINEKNRHNKRERWVEYYEVTGSFLTPRDIIVDGRPITNKSIDFGYSFTCHKSQGGTFTEVYVDYRDFNTCSDIQMKNQLLYVGLSRCTDKAIMFC